ncbi:MAG: hydrogenase expression/formation protein HypE [candidate division Zixibacteria bacterium]|nr:hydrogenase expression/formation protein HypE [candidate division Zixibacteria bacterium]
MKPEDISCPLPIGEHDTVQLSHGSGGRMTQDLVSRLFLWAFDNHHLNRRDDAALLDVARGKLAFSTDTFVVDPIFFPGGSIGDLAVNGTVNDLCCHGGIPRYLSAGFVLEEGLLLTELKSVVVAMKRAAEAARVSIVCGDTKVVNRGKGDKIFVNTSGLATIEHPYRIGADQLRPGDRILINGTIGDHGVAILSCRQGLSFQTPIESDTAPLCDLVQAVLSQVGEGLHAMRDATRGGVAATLNELAASSDVGIQLQSDALPVAPAVRGACELLGLDPLYVANEGKMLFVVTPEVAAIALNALRAHPQGVNAAIIGEVVAESSGMVSVRMPLGTSRIVDMPVGEQLPRIC